MGVPPITLDYCGFGPAGTAAGGPRPAAWRKALREAMEKAAALETTLETAKQGILKGSATTSHLQRATESDLSAKRVNPHRAVSRRPSRFPIAIGPGA